MQIDPEHVVIELGRTAAEFLQSACCREKENTVTAARVEDPRTCVSTDSPCGEIVGYRWWSEESAPRLAKGRRLDECEVRRHDRQA
jgi:hypothetical protein